MLDLVEYVVPPSPADQPGTCRICRDFAGLAPECPTCEDYRGIAHLYATQQTSPPRQWIESPAATAA